MKVLTSQFYSMCFYGCAAWLFELTCFKDVRRLNSVHFRSLRIATRDFKRTQHRSDLDRLGRARPSTWAKYLTTSLTIKTIRDGFPVILKENMMRNSSVVQHKPGRLKFFDGSTARIGSQMIDNRLTHMNSLHFDWLDGLSDDRLRQNLTRNFKNGTPHWRGGFSPGWGNSSS